MSTIMATNRISEGVLAGPNIGELQALNADDSLAVCVCKGFKLSIQPGKLVFNECVNLRRRKQRSVMLRKPSVTRKHLPLLPYSGFCSILAFAQIPCCIVGVRHEY